ncbi:hypothetical protein Tco_0340435 [Tanacetum coccineum]
MSHGSNMSCFKNGSNGSWVKQFGSGRGWRNGSEERKEVREGRRSCALSEGGRRGWARLGGRRRGGGWGLCWDTVGRTGRGGGKRGAIGDEAMGMDEVEVGGCVAGRGRADKVVAVGGVGQSQYVGGVVCLVRAVAEL